MAMQNNILCGSSCVKYILESKNINVDNLNYEMLWITELANAIFESGIKNVQLRCFNSNLYNDFIIKKDVDLTFSGFKFLNEILKKGININVIKMDLKSFQKELLENEYIILCVKSNIFNNSDNMDGGHFIIVNNEILGNKIKIINPIKDKYEEKYMTIKELIKCCKNYGSWRLLIKED